MTRKISKIIISAIIASGLPQIAKADSQYETSVLATLNFLREHPEAQMLPLARYRTFFHQKMVIAPKVKYAVATEEGVQPVDEAIGFLSRQPKVAALSVSPILARGARDLVADQSNSGRTGHIGSDGLFPGERTERRGGGPFVSEVITYGADTPGDVIRQLLIDDGVPDRSHRHAIFDPQLRYAGVSCGRHPIYRTMCVIDFAITADGRPDIARGLRFASFTPTPPE